MKICSYKHYLTTTEDFNEQREYLSYVILFDAKYGWEGSTEKFILMILGKSLCYYDMWKQFV
jgi:hypothetical protein